MSSRYTSLPSLSTVTATGPYSVALSPSPKPVSLPAVSIAPYCIRMRVESLAVTSAHTSMGMEGLVTAGIGTRASTPVWLEPCGWGCGLGLVA